MTNNAKYEAVAHSAAEKPKIRFLEVAVGNLCNLKCIMCGISYSYKWKSDEKALTDDKSFRLFRPPHETIKLTDVDLNISKEFLSELTDIKVVGGEPLFQPLMIDFLERLVQMGLAKQIAVEIYTNATHWPSERALAILGSFREVQLLFSIDGVGAHGEYIRYPSKWIEVEGNIKKWLKVPEQYPSIYLSCNFTINLLNAYYYDTVADWWHGLTKGTRYEKHLETTFVNYPHYLSQSLLPEQLKSSIRSKLEAYRDRHPERNYVKYNTKRIISRLNLKPEGSLDDFFHYIDRLDAIRKNKYTEVFPEFSELLRPYRREGATGLTSSPL